MNGMSRVDWSNYVIGRRKLNHAEWASSKSSNYIGMSNGRCYQRRTNIFDAKINEEPKLVMSCCFVGKHTKRKETEKKAIRARILIPFSTQNNVATIHIRSLA